MSLNLIRNQLKKKLQKPFLKLWKGLEEDPEIGNKFITWVYGITILLWIVSCSIWITCGINIFYIGNALTILGLCLVIYLLNTKIPKWLSSFGCFVAGNNLLDELIFEPWEFNWTEYILGIIAFLYYYKKYRTTT